MNLKTNRYSVPFMLIGKVVELERRGEAIVTCHHANPVTAHPVVTGRHQVAIVPEHDPGAIAGSVWHIRSTPAPRQCNPCRAHHCTACFPSYGLDSSAFPSSVRTVPFSGHLQKPAVNNGLLSAKNGGRRTRQRQVCSGQRQPKTTSGLPPERRSSHTRRRAVTTHRPPAGPLTSTC